MDVVRLALSIVLLIIVLICIYAYVRVKSFMKTYFGDREVGACFKSCKRRLFR